ncbi:MAG: hypothetical protein ACMXYL_00270 [Candidatus Woesearchaeota archaeon]
MKKALLLLIILLTAIMIIEESVAFGVSPGRKQYDYQPQLDGYINIINSHKESGELIIVARGELSEYVIFSERTIKLDPNVHENRVHYTVRVPQDKLEPGSNEIDVYIMPMTFDTDQSTVSAQAGIIFRIIVNLPYDGAHATGRIDYNSRTNTIIIPVTNVGTQRIEDARASVSIIGPTGDIISSKSSSSKTIGIRETIEYNIPLDGISNGHYLARATIEYDNKILVIERNIAVGTALIAVQSIEMPEFRYGHINRIDINVKSEWNQVIEDAYAMIEIIGPAGTLIERIKTPGERIEPYRTSILRGYWDTAGITPGDHQIIATAVGEGGNDTKRTMVTITPTGIVMQQPTGRVAGEGGMGILGVALAFLIIANIILFAIILSGRNKNKKNKKQ